MKRNRYIFICYMIAAVCFYLSFILELFSKNYTRSFMDFTLATAFLCFAFSYKNKGDKK